jgi:NitT/TauT family transport system substrate-binding protein
MRTLSRKGFTVVAAAALGGAPTLVRAQGTRGTSLVGPPEMRSVKVGLAVQDVSYLNLYLAQSEGLWTKEGLNVEFVAFPGDAPVTQALAGGSVDLNIASMIGLLNLIEAGQTMKTVHCITNQAVFSFVGNAKVKKWADLKGGTFGVASYGSLTASLATAALAQHGLIVNKDIQLVQTGGTPNAYAALLSGQLSGSTVQLTYAIRARSTGLNVLGTQQQITGPVWPAEVVYAKDSFLRANPRTITAILRGIAAADGLIQTQPEKSVKALVDALKLEPEVATEAYRIVKNTFEPRGAFPRDMAPFWKVMVAANVVKAPVPTSSWYDPTWFDNYTAWKVR